MFVVIVSKMNVNNKISVYTFQVTAPLILCTVLCQVTQGRIVSLLSGLYCVVCSLIKFLDCGPNIAIILSQVLVHKDF